MHAGLSHATPQGAPLAGAASASAPPIQPAWPASRLAGRGGSVRLVRGVYNMLESHAPLCTDVLCKATPRAGWRAAGLASAASSSSSSSSSGVGRREQACTVRAELPPFRPVYASDFLVFASAAIGTPPGRGCTVEYRLRCRDNSRRVQASLSRQQVVEFGKRVSAGEWMWIRTAYTHWLAVVDATPPQRCYAAWHTRCACMHERVYTLHGAPCRATQPTLEGPRCGPSPPAASARRVPSPRVSGGVEVVPPAPASRHLRPCTHVPCTSACQQAPTTHARMYRVPAHAVPGCAAARACLPACPPARLPACPPAREFFLLPARPNARRPLPPALPHYRMAYGNAQGRAAPLAYPLGRRPYRRRSHRHQEGKAKRMQRGRGAVSCVHIHTHTHAYMHTHAAAAAARGCDPPLPPRLRRRP